MEYCPHLKSDVVHLFPVQKFGDQKFGDQYLS